MGQITGLGNNTWEGSEVLSEARGAGLCVGWGWGPAPCSSQQAEPAAGSPS